MARQLLIVLVLIAAALPLQSVSAQSSTTPAIIVNVVDGDTVDVLLIDGTTERIRLIGMDTPEVVDPRKPVQCFGREASAHAHELLDSQEVALELDPSQGDRDIYGRLLAYLWMPDGRNFGEAMIAHGFAHEYTYDQPYAYLDAFSAARDLAIANQAGLWSPDTCAGDTTRPASPPVAAEQLLPAPAEPVPAEPAPVAPVPAEPAPVAPVPAEPAPVAPVPAEPAPVAPVPAEPAPVAPAPAPVPASPPVAPLPKPAAPSYSGPYDPSGPDRDCGDFRTHADAQAFYFAAGGPGADRHRLDADRDGSACETLP